MTKGLLNPRSVVGMETAPQQASGPNPQSFPLAGFGVGVTADRRAEEQAEMFRRRGAEVMLGPAVRTLPFGRESAIREATAALIAQPPDVLIANTGIGIRSWFGAAEGMGLGVALISALAGTRILARGAKAAGAVLTAGLDVAWRSPNETLAEAVDLLLSEVPGPRRVAVQLDGNTVQSDVHRLEAAGISVVSVRVYEWTRPESAEPALRLLEATCDGRLDAVTFTSAAAVENFFDLAEMVGRAEELRSAFAGNVVAMCVGDVCASALTRRDSAGLVPPRGRLGSMVHTLTDVLASRRRTVRLAGCDVIVNGSAVEVDGTVVRLTQRERDIFEVLLARNGAVVSRNDFKRALHNVTVTDHAIEVTVARLRARLGPAGSAIETVVRRGYRLGIESG